MAVELNFVKENSDTWGFRLTGGAEYDVPLTVIKVTENSIAERGGLRINDVIVKVNEIETTALTHLEAHDVLTSTGNHLNLIIRRDLPALLSPSICEDEINEEISNILQSCTDEEAFEHERQVQFEIINPEETLQTSQVPTEEILKQTKVDIQSEVEERKWSTFLQKPKNAIPKIKSTDEAPKGVPYRVVITKQKKKVPGEEKNQEMNQTEIEISEECEQNVEFTAESNVTIMEEVEVEEEFVEGVSVKADISEEGEIIIDDDEKAAENEEISTEMRLQNEKNAAVDKLLGEKLAEVQKQLEALSKLPSTIQSTIDAVTKQLATIVNIKTTSVETEEIIISSVSSESDNNQAKQEIIEESEVLVAETIDETYEENLDEEIEDTIEANEEVQEEKPDENVVEPDPDEALTEEEKKAREELEELLEKQKKEREQLEEFKQRRLKQKPTLPLKPIERPIILPGGRRWSQPDDACPSVRNPKMSDEKIANTIETYSEVILGKTKGINFLKYQPPPKNLDYLQRSDVYKLVHDLEPPVRGISSRASKILAEQDYHQAG